MTSRQFIRWAQLHERRAHRGLWRSPWLIALVAGVMLAAFVYWRGDAAGPVSASRTWLAGALAASALAFMRVPFHLYWRGDASLLAQLPIGGGPLFDAALLRCVRAAAATTLAIAIGAAGLAALDAPVEILLRHAALAGLLGLVAAALLPAVALWAATMVAHGRTTLELVTELGGAPTDSTRRPAHAPPSTTMLGALPGFASTVVITLVIVVAPWLVGDEAALPAAAVLGGLGAASALALVAARAAAPRTMGTILRDVSALDRQQLATLEIHPPTRIERGIAALIGDAALLYGKDARLMRRRYPMAFALGGLAFLVLVIVGIARPADPTPWLVAVLAGAVMYGVALAGRLFRPPIELPRLAATLPIRPEARTRAKVAWIAGWAVMFVAIPLVFATLRLL